MKLRNKKTGEIVEAITGDTFEVGGVQLRTLRRDPQIVRYYNSLAELNEEWEDCEEEPKKYWYIDIDGEITCGVTENGIDKDMQRIGNYFDTREETEKAVEKLKAWKRLKDNGFRFVGKTYETDKRFGSIFYKVDEDTYSEDIIHELDLLFGGEE